ncbi:hypothetical protein ABW19_dt0208031 [Dactylella cylindrospora]|nr:hypothetical protein ABW19_dt0208031 [Dactylella cylindrospora]
MELKSRAALKLMEIDAQYKLLEPGMTVVDLGFAPGSWSQVAVSKTAPNGRVIGVDLLPAQPPKGASSIQGDFLSPGIQASIRKYLSDPDRGRRRPPQSLQRVPDEPAPYISTAEGEDEDATTAKIDTNPILELDTTASSSYIAQERRETWQDVLDEKEPGSQGVKERDTVDVVLSDMCEAWPLTQGFHLNTVLIPWYRLMNTSGVGVRDHAGSMELCTAALKFCVDVLKPGGSFVCKFYQGKDDKALQRSIERVFDKVVRMKPETSRAESKENYFVAVKKRTGVKWEDVEKLIP